MKKILILMAVFSLLISSCAIIGKEQSDFEEIEKIEVEVKDYVEQSPTPSTEQTETSAPDVVIPDAPIEVIKTPDTATTSTQQNQNSEKAPETNSTEAVQPEAEKKGISGKIICIDAGHGNFTENKEEKIAPSVDTLKAGYTEGTKGSVSKEDDVVLAVAKKLKAVLSENGATVVMTRTDENATMSNVERAQFANTNNADICVKLHADGTLEGGSGMTMLFPSKKYIDDADMVDNSKRLASLILKNAVSHTGANNRGMYANSKMAGFNWSEVPVVLFEMGFMTNPKDEAKLNDEEYQNKIVQGIFDGINEYFN